MQYSAIPPDLKKEAVLPIITALGILIIIIP